MSGYETQLNNDKYPSPFFNMASMFFPRHLKSLFNWCEYFFLTNPIINNCVNKLSEYAITDVIYNHENLETKNYFKEIFEQNFDIKRRMVEFNLDYFVFGNAFFSLNTPFKRFLTCQSCKEKIPFGEADWSFNNFEFHGACPKCQASGKFEIYDMSISDPKRMNIIRWDPKRMSIKYNGASGLSQYRYDLDANTKKLIKTGDPFILETTPKLFIDSVKTNKNIILENDNLYHFKRYSLSGLNEAWGLPLVLPALQTVYYTSILNSAAEQIAHERSVPHEFLFPMTGQEAGEPWYDGTEFSQKIESEIKAHRRDPNLKSVIPFPIGKVMLGGEAKMLIPWQEKQMATQEIIAAMNVPTEFVFGGLGYAGSSVSLRMLENSIISNRLHHIKALKWLANKVGKTKQIEESKVPIITMAKFKMADDPQQKQIALQLNQLNKVSDTTLLNENGFDRDDEIKTILSEQKVNLEIMENIQQAQNKVQILSQSIMSKQQVEDGYEQQIKELEMLKQHQEKIKELYKMKRKMELENKKIDIDVQEEFVQENPMAFQKMQEPPIDGQTGKEQIPGEEQTEGTEEAQGQQSMEDETNAVTTQKQQPAIGGNPFNQKTAESLERSAGQYARKLKALDPLAREVALEQIKASNLNLYSKIIKKITPNAGAADAQGNLFKI